MGNHAEPPRRRRKGRWRTSSLAFALLFLLVAFVTPLWQEPPTEVVSYSAFKALVRDGSVERVLLMQDTINAEIDEVEPRKVRAVVTAQPDAELLPLLEAEGVEIVAEVPQDYGCSRSCCPRQC